MKVTSKGRYPLLGVMFRLTVLSFIHGPLSASAAPPPGSHWVGTWSASPQTQETSASGNAPSFTNQTLRQIVHASLGGAQVRVRFSNLYGTAPLVIGAASVGLSAGEGSLVAGSLCPLTFGGNASVTVAPGALAVSDAARLNVPAMSDLAVSLYLPNTTVGSTMHTLAYQINYNASGDQTAAVVAPADAAAMGVYYFVKNVEVLAPGGTGAVVCLGDSITDGAYSTVNANNRWPNLLAQRLLGRPGTAHQMAVLDQGIGGNRLLHEGTGADILSRFDPDVIAQAGVTDVIVLAGINDIGFSASIPGQAVSAADLIAAYRQLIVRAHDAGLTIYGGTLTPFAGTVWSYYTNEGENIREAVNAYIRTGGEFDGVIDFEAALSDGSTPPAMQPQYDSGDHLHPNDAGYAAMARAVPLGLLRNKAP